MDAPPSPDPVLAALARCAKWKLIALGVAMAALWMPWIDGDSDGHRIHVLGWDLFLEGRSDICALPRAALPLAAMNALAFCFLRRPSFSHPLSASVFVFWAGTIAFEAYPICVAGDALWSIGSCCGPPLQWDDVYLRSNLERHLTPGAMLFVEALFVYVLLALAVCPYWLSRAMRLRSEQGLAAHVEEGTGRPYLPHAPAQRPWFMGGLSVRSAFLLLALGCFLLPWGSVRTTAQSLGPSGTVPGRGPGTALLRGDGGKDQLRGSIITAGSVLALLALARIRRPRVATLGDRERWMLCATEILLSVGWALGLCMTVAAGMTKHHGPLAEPADLGWLLCLQALIACVVESIVFAIRPGASALTLR